VFGRSVTFVLQTLRSIDEQRFDGWYDPWRAEMAEDPLLKHFNAASYSAYWVSELAGVVVP
jgi:hypothetical protein